MTTITLKCIYASDIGFSDEAWEDINNSSNITFGDANRTLYSAQRLNERVTFQNQMDKDSLNEIIKTFGPGIYIDLEN